MKQEKYCISWKRLGESLLVALMLVLVGTAVVNADPSTDRRLNGAVHLGGATVYCVDANGRPANAWEHGGLKILDHNGALMVFVPASAIDAAFQTLQQTGQYITLGVSQRLWYGGAPIAVYLLPSGEFQVNAYDEYEKLVEFRWTGCQPVLEATEVEQEESGEVEAGDIDYDGLYDDWEEVWWCDGCVPPSVEIVE